MSLEKNKFVKISGSGLYLLQKIVKNSELEEKLGLEAGWIERRTGIRERRYASHEDILEMYKEYHD